MSKTVWITGASSGIGREFARRYARLGFRLILTARRTDRLEALAAELTAKHSTFCRILPADLEQESECARLCEALADERIDLFITTPASRLRQLLEISGEKELSMAKVNVLAMHQLFKFAVKKMEAQGFGTVLNVASSAGLLPGGPYMAGYYATKAYVVSLTRGVAEELRQQHSPVYVCASAPARWTPSSTSGPMWCSHCGASARNCASRRHAGMLRARPSSSVGLMRAATTAQRFMPMAILMPSWPTSRRKNWLKGYCVQQAAIPAFAEPVFMTISRKRSKMRKNLQ